MRATEILPQVSVIDAILLFRRLGLIGEAPQSFDRTRCRGRGLMGPAILLTLGFQFLLDSMGVIRFSRTLPLLLVVIGLVKIFESTTSSGPPSGQAGPPPSGVVTGEVQPPPAEVKNG